MKKPYFLLVVGVSVCFSASAFALDVCETYAKAKENGATQAARQKVRELRTVDANMQKLSEIESTRLSPRFREPRTYGDP